MQRIYKQLFYVVSFLMVGGFFVMGSVSASLPTVDPSVACDQTNQETYSACSSCVTAGGTWNPDAFPPSCEPSQAVDPTRTSNDGKSNLPASSCPIYTEVPDPVTGICSCPKADDGMKEIAQDGACKRCDAPGVCCGVKLNTSIPFIGNCIESNTGYIGAGKTAVSATDAFPTLIGSLTKILISVILIVCFILIIVAGVMIASGKPADGKKMIMNVAIGLALLGASGVILHLINPNFFG